MGVQECQRLVTEERRERTRAVALHALSGVVLGTRVDTSRARSNWQVAERNERTALAIAAESVETARQCVTSYEDSADSMGAAVRSLLGVAE